MAFLCAVCREGIVDSRNRRSVHSSATRHVLPVLLELAADVFPNQSASNVLFPADAHMCRTCLRSVEQLMKLKQDVHSKEQQLRERIECTGQAYGLEMPRSAPGATVALESGDLAGERGKTP